jgi:hypothetical protein
MSRHRRKRRPRTAAPARPQPAAAPRRAPAARERPKAPWHPLPLVELCVLVGLVLLVVGGLRAGTARGRTLLVFGMALGSLGGLDTALREHWAGYRSHTTVLAAGPAVLVAALLFFVRAPWLVVILGAGAVGVAAFAGLRGVYRS